MGEIKIYPEQDVLDSKYRISEDPFEGEDFAMSGSSTLSMKKSTRSFQVTLTSGEGLLQTFRGTSSVWLAPTQAVYQRLQVGGMSTLCAATRGSNTAT